MTFRIVVQLFSCCDDRHDKLPAPSNVQVGSSSSFFPSCETGQKRHKLSNCSPWRSDGALILKFPLRASLCFRKRKLWIYFKMIAFSLPLPEARENFSLIFTGQPCGAPEGKTLESVGAPLRLSPCSPRVFHSQLSPHSVSSYSQITD